MVQKRTERGKNVVHTVRGITTCKEWNRLDEVRTKVEGHYCKSFLISSPGFILSHICCSLAQLMMCERFPILLPSPLLLPRRLTLGSLMCALFPVCCYIIAAREQINNQPIAMLKKLDKSVNNNNNAGKI